MSQATSTIDWLRPRGYFAKFVLSFIGLVVLVLFVNAGLETWFMYRETTQFVVKTESEKAEATARRIEQFFSETERQISWATRASTTTIEQRRQDYQLLVQQVPAISRAIYLDSTGREQVRLTRDAFVAGSNLDYSGDPRFKEAQGKAVWWSPVYFNGRDPFIAVAVAHSGRNAGSTVAEISLKFLSDYIEREQIGQDTEAYVVDQSGHLLSHSDPKEQLGSNYASLPQVSALLNRSAEVPMTGKDPEGTSVLSASATVRQLNWRVFFEQPLSTALRPVYSLLFRTGWLVLLGIGLSVLAGMLLAQRLVTPIKALHLGARQLETSNFGHRIEVDSKDEMGELADQFNRMADELHGSYTRTRTKGRRAHTRSCQVEQRAQGSRGDRPRGRFFARHEVGARHRREPSGGADSGGRWRALYFRSVAKPVQPRRVEGSGSRVAAVDRHRAHQNSTSVRSALASTASRLQFPISQSGRHFPTRRRSSAPDTSPRLSCRWWGRTRFWARSSCSAGQPVNFPVSASCKPSPTSRCSRSTTQACSARWN